jgi:putative protease
VGDSLELITPVGNHGFCLEAMQDLDGNTIAVAPGAGHRVTIPVPRADCAMGLVTRDLGI